MKGKKIFLIFKNEIKSNAKDETIIHAHTKTKGTSNNL